MYQQSIDLMHVEQGSLTTHLSLGGEHLTIREGVLEHPEYELEEEGGEGREGLGRGGEGGQEGE